MLKLQKSIHVQYFAKLHEQRGLSQELCSTEADTAEEFYIELQERFGLTEPIYNMRLAIDDRFADWSAPLKDGDKIVFIPPVSGG